MTAAAATPSRRTGRGANIIYLFHLIQDLDPVQDILLARLLNLSGEDVLVQYAVNSIEVEDNVELADVGEVSIQKLDEEVDGLQVRQLVVGDVDRNREEESSVSPVDKLVVVVLDEIGVLLVAGRYQPMDLGFYAGLLDLGC